MITRISCSGPGSGAPPSPLSFGSHESNLPSVSRNLKEHMKNTHRQKMMSTIGTTLMGRGLSSASPPPAMGSPLRVSGLEVRVGGAGAGSDHLSGSGLLAASWIL